MNELGAQNFDSTMKIWWQHFDVGHFLQQSQLQGLFERLAQKFGMKWKEVDADPELGPSLERATNWFFA